jgi:hypothetical protein
MQNQEPHSDEQLDEEPIPERQDYRRYAILSLLLYFVLWVPGFLVNTVYLAQAIGEERKTGQPAEGKGCLIALIIAGLVIPITAVCVLVIISLGEVA